MTAAIPVLNAAEVHRISAIAARIQSDQDGEVINAGRMLVRVLDKHGLRIGDVIETALRPRPVAWSAYEPQPASATAQHQRQARECMACAEGVLTPWERQFIASVIDRTRISPRQREILADITAKVRRRTGGAHG